MRKLTVFGVGGKIILEQHMGYDAFVTGNYLMLVKQNVKVSESIVIPLSKVDSFTEEEVPDDVRPQ